MLIHKSQETQSTEKQKGAASYKLTTPFPIGGETGIIVILYVIDNHAVYASAY